MADPRGAAAHPAAPQVTTLPADAVAVPVGDGTVLPPDPLAVGVVATGLTTISAALSSPAAPTPADSVGDRSGAAGPTQQIAAGLQTLSRMADGNRQLVMRLDPAELGRVQIAIDQPKDGPASVVLTVERPETLLLVLRDQTGLHQALERAGVAADGRTINIQLAPPRADPQPTSQQGGDGQPGGGALDLDARQGGRFTRHDPGFADDEPGTPGSLLRHDPRPTWSRVGIDITA